MGGARVRVRPGRAPGISLWVLFPAAYLVDIWLTLRGHPAVVAVAAERAAALRRAPAWRASRSWRRCTTSRSIGTADHRPAGDGRRPRARGLARRQLRRPRRRPCDAPVGARAPMARWRSWSTPTARTGLRVPDQLDPAAGLRHHRVGALEAGWPSSTTPGRPSEGHLARGARRPRPAKRRARGTAGAGAWGGRSPTSWRASRRAGRALAIDGQVRRRSSPGGDELTTSVSRDGR